jgi:hypothetical protein
MPDDDLTARRAWVERWRLAGRELERRRTRDLAGLREADAAAITRELLSMWRPGPQRSSGSGLVEQQRVFQASHRRRIGAQR